MDATFFLTIYNPNPVPSVYVGLLVMNGSNINGNFSGGMPGPWLITCIVHLSLSDSDLSILRVTVLPLLLYFIALANRLVTIWFRLRGSLTITGGRSPIESLSLMCSTWAIT